MSFCTRPSRRTFPRREGTLAHFNQVTKDLEPTYLMEAADKEVGQL